MKKILVFDNYDSFTYNLVHAIEKIDPEAQVDVVLNDKFNIDEASSYDAIVLSPGPGIPEEAGELLPLISKFRGVKPILGVCLGHQAIAVVSGGELVNLQKVFHGVATPVKITVQGSLLLRGIPDGFDAGRYHSWVVNKEKLPSGFIVTSEDSEGNIMSMEKADEKLYSVQFHPESIMTPQGENIIRNFLSLIE